MISTFILMAAASVPPPVDGPLQPLSFLVGHCWRGEYKASGTVDTHCFEPLYGGKHVRDRHEVTGGKSAYRGETTYSWNGRTKRIEFTYVNSDGDVSRGSATPVAANLDFGDEVVTLKSGKEIRISTLWRRIGDTAYEAVTRSEFMPGGQRVVTFTRVD